MEKKYENIYGTSSDSKCHHCSGDHPAFSQKCLVLKFKIDLIKIPAKECLSIAQARQSSLILTPNKLNFANLVKKTLTLPELDFLQRVNKDHGNSTNEMKVQVNKT